VDVEAFPGYLKITCEGVAGTVSVPSLAELEAVEEAWLCTAKPGTLWKKTEMVRLLGFREIERVSLDGCVSILKALHTHWGFGWAEGESEVRFTLFEHAFTVDHLITATMMMCGEGLTSAFEYLSHLPLNQLLRRVELFSKLQEERTARLKNS